MATQFNALKKGFATLRESEELSDCKSMCGPYHFNLHEAVLASHSDYFRTAFKTGTFKEGESGTIVLKATESDAEEVDDACDDPEIVKFMVDYFYHFDYLPDADERVRAATPKVNAATFVKDLVDEMLKKQESERTRSSVDEVSTTHDRPTRLQNFIAEHAKVFAMAVKYQIDGLHHLAVEKFDRERRKYSVWSHDDLAHAVSIIYSSTPEDMKQLRDLVKDDLDYYFQHLILRDDIKAVVSSIPQLSFDLLELSHDRQTRARKYKPLFRVCVSCDCAFPSTHDGLPGSDPLGYQFCSITCAVNRSRPELLLNVDHESGVGNDY